MKHVALIASLLVLPPASWAQSTTTTLYTLLGSYLVQTSSVQTSSWAWTPGVSQGTNECIDSNDNLHTASGGGSSTYMQSIYGTLTFSCETSVHGCVNGQGGVTSSGTKGSIFDQVASEATVDITWSADGNCTPTINNGYAVFDAPTEGSESGTYSINPETGAGTMSLGGGTKVLQATGVYAYCTETGGLEIAVLSTILEESYSNVTPNLISATSIAQHGNQVGLNPCQASTQ